MRFSALLLLAALAGALVCAQDASSDPTEATPGTVATEPEVTTSPAETVSPQETPQEPNSATTSKEGLNPLKFLVSKGSLVAEHGFQEARKKLREGKLYERGVELAEKLKKFVPSSFLLS
ncbi:extracellular glycoprotein lacritin isoform X1 [Neofelis nebulosa]|uniref:Extracellular glycoprotein lacritin n=1 Tax=Puma concolor TaxID=9696 RepID=A0A6P6IEK2_PUMCO|nr:extracellular glycoprotein lacritin [Panthera tigris]XP_025786646.1 extracellular glycoprotein lacritin [Puma concolor]XP_042802705.1 extracellular glycoprotein lacritin [Panthera leo]XP_049481627.1 extracellular glycoprotein lacritin [Panthera uncia]XP_058598469.1 extracellular glycoprotein lacritin isoform X1 [Neofelis nebulosa]XP_060513356.1 extracellular glycoprotein lacritin [Panthera onca]